MDEITLNKLIVDNVIKYLRTGTYVHYTNTYQGNYIDGALSRDRYKIDKDKVLFVKYPHITTLHGEVNLIPMSVSMVLEGKPCQIRVDVGIDTYDWTTFINIGDIREE